MFVIIKPLHVSVFYTTIFRGPSAVLRAVTIPPADLHSLSLYYYAVTQWTQISGTNSNGTKHSGGPSEDGKKKDRNMKGFYTYKHVFNILLVLNVEVSVF
jgi:hypothetical protein